MKKYYYEGIVIILFVSLILPLGALAWDCPTAKFRKIPDNMTNPGQEIKIQAETEGYSVKSEDEGTMLYGWCVDGIFLNTIVAGSSDEIVTLDDGTLQLKNKYGAIEGNLKGACSDEWRSAQSDEYSTDKKYTLTK